MVFQIEFFTNNYLATTEQDKHSDIGAVSACAQAQAQPQGTASNSRVQRISGCEQRSPAARKCASAEHRIAEGKNIPCGYLYCRFVFYVTVAVFRYTERPQ